jgi:UDP-glucose 6-dehydrogenase
VERNTARLHFEDDLGPVLEHARLLFVCVDTPPTYSGDADLSRVESVVEELPDSDEHAIVMKSTVPCGTGASIRRRLGELGKDRLGYASNPEFLQEGSAVADFMRPDRVVIGTETVSDPVGDALERLYEPLGSPIVRTDVASAEMIKLAANAFLATKISFINEIANVCEELGADVSEVAAGMGLDPRIGQSFLRAGIGYGGSCLVGDETVLIRRDRRVRLIALEALFAELEDSAVIDEAGSGVVAPRGLEVLSWRPGAAAPEFFPVQTVTRRPWRGQILEIRTKMGRRIRCTPDHPFIATWKGGSELEVTRASELSSADWLPVALSGEWGTGDELTLLPLENAVAAADLHPNEVIVQSSVAAQKKRIAPTGFRKRDGVAWVRVAQTTSSAHDGFVYSLEVPHAETFVTTGGLVVHNCFPKDVSALKQLAGNSGYHFQLLTAVIEVNELQKRRVVNKLKRHLGSLIGKRIALLGLAFKPNTDDMREASSVVLAARLQAEGAVVNAYDPVAEGAARELLTGVQMCDTAMNAITGANAVVIVTEWPEFAALDLAEVRKRMADPVIVDGRNLLNPEEVKAAGLVYEGIGRT